VITNSMDLPGPLPSTFQFSQAKLQDYVDCKRRFQLRYVLMQPWPALITDAPLEFEQHRQRGTDLHQLIHQHTLDINAERLTATIHDPTLAGWWRTYLAHPPHGLPEAIRRAELLFTAPLADYRLAAKIDLVAADPGRRLVVVDWKTVHKRPLRSALARRLQTRVYLYLAVEAGTTLNGGQQPQPQQVEMVYWFAGHDGATERFPYDPDQHAASSEYLASLIAEISAVRDPIWPLTPDESLCRFCNYRSLCERGVKAGFLADLDEDVEPADLEIDLEQIAEVEF
jgi:CRISPR/Cas system-associated exonuclease Cas4 (RecB family)